MKCFKLYEDCLFKNVASKKSVEIWDIIRMIASGEIVQIIDYSTGKDVTEEYVALAKSNLNNGPDSPLKPSPKVQKCPRCKVYNTINKYNCNSCLSVNSDMDDLNYYAF